MRLTLDAVRLTPARRFMAGVCSVVALDASASPVDFDEAVVWGRNLGGAAVELRSGERFEADDCSARPETPCGRIAPVRRTQNPGLYDGYRRGEQHYRITVDKGRYDLVLYFAEPDPVAGSERSIRVQAEGSTLLENFNLLAVKEQQVGAAVTRTFPGIAVDDGEFDLHIGGTAPLLSAILLRRSRFSVEGWELVWADEFDGDALSEANWSPEHWAPGRVNNELQSYTDDRRNLRVEDGRLIIEAHRELSADDEVSYSSARVHSAGKMGFLYGRLDIRARIPGGQGVWPALWLLPSDPYRYATNCDGSNRRWQGNDRCDAWPNSGEIDLMEHVGWQPGVVHGTVHTRDFSHLRGTQIGEAVQVPGLGTAFQVFSLVWEPERIAMYVDGVRFYSYLRDGSGPGQWPFDHAFHVVMNLAVGGFWGLAGGPVDPAVFPSRLEVDYVRLYRPEGPDAPAILVQPDPASEAP